MTVTVPPRIELQIKRLIDSGRYPDIDAVLDDAFRLLDERDQERFTTARALVIAGFASGDAGELTEEMMDDIERDAEAAFQRGDQPSWHVRLLNTSDGAAVPRAGISAPFKTPSASSHAELEAPRSGAEAG